MSNVYFERVCRVTVLNREAIIIQDHRIKFEVTKSIKQQENAAKIEIYNLSALTRKKIGLEQSIVQLEAGYKSNQGLIQIGQGTICQVASIRDKTDTISRFLLKDGLKNIKSTILSISYENDVKLSDILNKISSEANLSLKIVGLDASTTIRGGYTMLGGIDSQLNDLASSFAFKWSIQNNVLLIVGNKQNNLEQILLLTPTTGLILNPETLKKPSQKLQKLKDKGQLSTEINLYTVQALLQPQLQLNDVIAIESQDLSGKFRVQKITHSGDTRGNDWYSDLEVRSI